MKPTTRFSLAALPAFHPSRESRGRLLFDGASTRQTVFGDEIIAQFECGAFFVVVTNYDWFDGVSTWFHLLDRQGRIIDIMSPPAYFGFMQDTDLADPGRLHFGFYGTHDRWTLHVSEAPFWSLKRSALAWRPLRFWLRKRHLSLECKKGETWVFQSTDMNSRP